MHNVREVDKPTYRIDKTKIKRYNQRKMIFNRAIIDPEFAGYMRGEDEVGLRNIAAEKSGYTRIDYALSEAAWTAHDCWSEAFGSQRLSRIYGPSLMGSEWYQEKVTVENPLEMSRIMKKAAKFFGADLVGVAEYNSLWMQENTRRTLEPLEMPEGVNRVIVCAVEMNEEALSGSPNVIAGAATGLGYSKMAFISATLAEFVRNLGYIAVSAGNDVGLSIPEAIDAGLGQLGRNGLLITPEYGSRIRLFKVYTDLPLEPDKPIDFRAPWFCMVCKRCAMACPVYALSFADEPDWKPACSSSNPGALKWYVDGEKCYEFWLENGMDCSNCITTCPYSLSPVHQKPEEFWGSNVKPE
jgi:epoxyqueuosine reductase